MDDRSDVNLACQLLSKVASLFRLVPPAVVAAVRIPYGGGNEFLWRYVVERAELDSDVVAADLFDVAAPERPYAAVTAEKMVAALGPELIIAKDFFPSKQTEGFRFDDDRPVSALGANRTVAFTRAGTQVGIDFEANFTAAATACICLHHACMTF